MENFIINSNLTEPNILKYSLPEETLSGLETSHHLSDLIQFDKLLIERGISTENTRIERYIKYLKLHLSRNSQELLDYKEVLNIFKNSKDSPCENSLSIHLYIMREVHELMWIYKGLIFHIPKGVDEKLEKIVCGRDFAALDSDTESRNTQFELRIASYFCQTGCDVDVSTETDVIVYTKKEAFYIECKRVATINKLALRINEAKKQLQMRMPKKSNSRTIFGCIAIDVTKVAFNHNGLTWAMTPDHSRDMIREKLIEIAGDPAMKNLFDIKKDKNICNCWFQIHIPALIRYPYTISTRFSSFHIDNGALTRKQNRAYTAFKEIFETASYGHDARLEKPKQLKIRNRIELPAGTTYMIDDDLVQAFYNSDELVVMDQFKIIGSLTVDGIMHEFCYEDFVYVFHNMDDTTREYFRKDIDKARLGLLLLIYQWRFPYEDTE